MVSSKCPVWGPDFFISFREPLVVCTKRSGRTAFCLSQCGPKLFIFFLNLTLVFALSCSGLSPANDSGAKKKKKKQKKKKEKSNETLDAAQDQPVKVKDLILKGPELFSDKSVVREILVLSTTCFKKKKAISLRLEKYFPHTHPVT